MGYSKDTSEYSEGLYRNHMNKIELWIWRIIIILLIIFSFYIYETRPITIENTKIYYATFTSEGELKIEQPKINKSMGCNTYWRAKGYSCYEY